MDNIVKVTKTYSTRSVERKLMEDSIKVSKSRTIERKRFRKGALVDENNIKVVEVGVMVKLILMLLLQ